MNPRQGGKTWPATDAISDASADVDDCYQFFSGDDDNDGDDDDDDNHDDEANKPG